MASDLSRSVDVAPASRRLKRIGRVRRINEPDALAVLPEKHLPYPAFRKR
jgi:hypothetical protein